MEAIKPSSSNANGFNKQRRVHDSIAGMNVLLYKIKKMNHRHMASGARLAVRETL